MKFTTLLLALTSCLALPAMAVDPPEAAGNSMPREVIEAGIQQIGRACIQQWASPHGAEKAAAFCDCINADDVAAIRRVKTVGDMDRWVLSAQEEARRHEAGDPQVAALFQQRFDRCEPALK